MLRCYRNNYVIPIDTNMLYYHSLLYIYIFEYIWGYNIYEVYIYGYCNYILATIYIYSIYIYIFIFNMTILKWVNLLELDNTDNWLFSRQKKIRLILKIQNKKYFFMFLNENECYMYGIKDPCIQYNRRFCSILVM